MDDRELLELAAKGARYEITQWDEDDYGRIYGLLNGERWMPQFSPEDAFVLQVRMGCRVYCYPGAGDDYSICATDDNARFRGWAKEDHGGDPLLSTCRAIVRAIAEIGRSMP